MFFVPEKPPQMSFANFWGNKYGGVKVSTGISKRSKRAEAHNFLKMCNLKLNANNNKLAVAA